MFLAEDINPLVPTSWEMTFTVMGLIQLALFFFCLFTIFRNPHIDAVQKLLWLIAVIVFPILGPAVWIYYSRALKLRNN